MHTSARARRPAPARTNARVVTLAAWARLDAEYSRWAGVAQQGLPVDAILIVQGGGTLYVEATAHTAIDFRRDMQ